MILELYDVHAGYGSSRVLHGDCRDRGGCHRQESSKLRAPASPMYPRSGSSFTI